MRETIAAGHAIENVKAGDVRAIRMEDFDFAFSRVTATVDQTELAAYEAWSKKFGTIRGGGI